MTNKTIPSIIVLLVVLCSCKAHKNLNVSAGFGNLKSLEGDWEVDSQIKIAFEIFEDSDGDSEIKLLDDVVLLEKFEGYYHESPWTMYTEYRVLENDSIVITVDDRHRGDTTVFAGMFKAGLVSTYDLEGKQKMEIDFSQKQFTRKIYNKIFNGTWELEQHWVYSPD
tara:strand:- start:95 stop:595 length:501 start_codon:yes stop_codon:yes gene_type:complete